jgi:hypothetical protein
MTARVHSRLPLLDEANSIQKDERSLHVLEGPTNILDSILAAIALGLTLSIASKAASLAFHVLLIIRYADVSQGFTH